MSNQSNAARQQPAEDADWLANAFRNVFRQLNGGRDQFKAPQYGGSVDVEIFIKKVTVVVQANNWNPQVAHLNLGLSLAKQKEIWTIPTT